MGPHRPESDQPQNSHRLSIGEALGVLGRIADRNPRSNDSDELSHNASSTVRRVTNNAAKLIAEQDKSSQKRDTSGSKQD